MEKSIDDYYMNLPYTVELKRPYGQTYQASLKEMPECMVSARASESLEELLRRLREVQRHRIETLLYFGEEVPEPPSVDPFCQTIPQSVEWEKLKRRFYEYGAALFALRLLVEQWLQELQDARFAKVASPGIPPKEGPTRLMSRV